MYEHTIEVLNRYGQRVIDLYRSNLSNSGHNATGRLSGTASFTVETSSGDLSVTIHLGDYYRYVEEGRRPGSFPPVDAILSWIQAKHIMPREINGKLPTEQQLAYLIGRKIAQEGITGTHDLANAQDTAKSQFENEIQEALKADYNAEALRYMQDAGLLTNLY